MKVKFVKDKETKNTYRYTAQGDVAGSIYVPKTHELAKQNEIVMELNLTLDTVEV